MITDASLSFVGNFDLSISQVVNSVAHDLFQPLPAEFDLAIMDRFAAYISGWEMPKNSSEFLTSSYGFITDYLADAFHYQFKHTNRYEEVSKRIQLGKSVEGRDEKGIKKTVCAFLKILHPTGSPTDEEFEEYVAYTVECRQRVKEQMNKRKPDDEFARINLSFVNAQGQEVVVYCPESKDAAATQQPLRRQLNDKFAPERDVATETIQEPRVPELAIKSNAPTPVVTPAVVPDELVEKHFTIMYGDVGHSYESIVGPYLLGAKTVVIEAPYIRLQHQIQNFVRFCECILKTGTVKKINLITGYDDNTQLADIAEKLEELKQSLLEMDVELEVKLNPNMHDQEIRLDNGWVIKIG